MTEFVEDIAGTFTGANDMTDVLNLFPNFLPKFRQFLVEKDVIVLIVALLLSDNISRFTTSIVDNFVQPLLNFDLNRDGNPDANLLFDFELNILGIKIKIGAVVKELVNFVIVLFVAFWVSNLTRDILD